MGSISPFGNPGTFWRGNLHTHSTLSDGRLEPSEVADAYQRKGYDFLMLSEHFVDLFDSPIADTRNFRSNRFTTILGAELHAPENSCGELWHIVAAGLPLDFAPCGDSETAEELAGRAADAGAFVSIAHPAWSQLNLFDGKAIESAHSVEIYNHGCAVENDRGDGWYLLEEMLRDGHRLSANATDDAHFHCDDAFGGWVHVKADSLDPDALLEGLKAGAFYSSQGPQIYDVCLSGTEVTVSCSPVNAIAVQGGSSRSVTRTGSAITNAELNFSKLNVRWTGRKNGPVQNGLTTDWIRVVVIDGAGKKAWSNPIWLDEQ
ncbi:MAG: CehA/McbA family metallohydrolase [Hyphomicrobiales bacterium]